MSELPGGMAPAAVPVPRESASGIAVRSGGDGIEVLLARRGHRSRFMPGHLAFPGGALEPGDEPGRPGACARCVRREVREETGLDVPEGAWVEIGWRTTPPMFPLRFHTAFFVAALPARFEPAPPAAGGEIEELLVALPRQILERWNAGTEAVPPPVLPLLRALEGATGSGGLADLAARLTAANAEEERAPRIEFFPGVWVVPQRTPTLPPATHTNAWMPGGERFVVVDPGSAEPEEVEQLLRVVGRRQSLGQRVQAVLLTHAHRDHAGGAVELARRLGVPLGAHARTLEALGASGQALADGAVLDLGGVTLAALHTPGHDPGHLAFHLREANLLLAGDLVSGLSTILIDPAWGRMETYLDSLARAERLAPRALLPAHGPPLPGAELRRVIAHRRERERRILDVLAAGPAELSALARAAWADTPDAPPALAERQALAHLASLERGGSLRRLDRAGTAWTAAPAGRRPDTPARIVERLTERLAPLHLELHDDSAAHAGHAGAAGGGGHYRVTVVSAAFEGVGRVQQHRMVHQALADLLDREIHALVVTTRRPGEWSG